jgi:DNA replicative helicase MCM subunit Mcm2 (Cdc46/Mcm family)
LFRYCNTENLPPPDSVIDVSTLREYYSIFYLLLLFLFFFFLFSKRYIAFARATCFPRLSDEASQELVEA